MNGKPSFLDDLKAQLLRMQLQKLERDELQPSYIQFRKKQSKARQALMDLEDLTSRVDNNTDHMQISRWNNHQEEVNLRLHERLSLTRRVPRLELNCEINLQTRSQRAIPQLKQLLSKLTSPVHKPTRKLQSNAKVVVQPRHNLKPHAVVKMVLDSPARVSKDEIKSIKQSPQQRKLRTLQVGSSENVKQQSTALRSISTNYTKIKRQSKYRTNVDVVKEKEILSQLLNSLGKNGPVAMSFNKMGNSINLQQINNIPLQPRTTSNTMALCNLQNYFSVYGERKKRAYSSNNII